MAEWRRGEQEMLQLGNAYSTSNWFVMAGSEKEFVRRWTALAEWVKNNVPGARSAVLIRSTDDPRRFLSVVAWETQEARDAWRERFAMQELHERCLELCEEFEVHTYTLAASTNR
jgi:heme-degrading monooxygenase HmoA